MVLTRSQTRAQRQQQNGENSQEEQQEPERTPRRTNNRPSTRRRNKRRRNDDDIKETARPEKKQRKLDKQDKENLKDQFYKRMLSELNCPVCTEMVSGPVTLFCGHSYCYDCLCRHIDARYPSANCPLCRVSIPVDFEPKVSVSLQNVVEGLMSSCFFEDSMEKKNFQRRASEHLAFKLNREANPPSRQCQCHQCRRERGDVMFRYANVNDIGFFRAALAAQEMDEIDEEEDDAEDAVDRIVNMFDSSASPPAMDGAVRNNATGQPRVISLTSSDEEDNGRNNENAVDEDSEDDEPIVVPRRRRLPRRRGALIITTEPRNEEPRQSRYPLRRTAARSSRVR